MKNLNMPKASRRPSFWVSFVILAIAVVGFINFQLQNKAHAAGNTLYVVATGGAATGACPVGTPCTLARALTAVTAGDTIVLNPGTYTGNLTLSGANHQNVTVTTTAQTISDLGTFTRGIPSGTDNRPLFSNGRIDVSAAGARISYLRVDNGNRRDGSYDGVIGVSATNVTIDHNEIIDGNQGVNITIKKQVTVTQNYIHSLGSMSSAEDTHGVAITATGGAIATGFSEAVNINNNTITDAGGDAIQEATNCYGSGIFSFLIIDNNDLFGNQEQGFDSKGTTDVRISNNDIYANGEGGIVSTTPEDCKTVNPMDRWDIYGNKIHDHDQYAIVYANGRLNCSNWNIYNNLIYNNLKLNQFNYAAVTLCGNNNNKFYSNVVWNNNDNLGSSSTSKSSGIRDEGGGAGIINNIFYNNGTGGLDHGNIQNISGEDGGTPTFNYVYPTTCTAACKTGNNVTSTCLTTNNCPGFVNLAGFDFSLLSNSPAIDKGTSLTAPFTVDYVGASRPQGAAFDLGAFEFAGVITPPTTFALTVSKSGTGSGTVSGTGISCGVDCSETVNSGTVVNLSAAASSGSTFAGWSGGGCSGTGTCNVTVSSNTTVTASFNTSSDTTPPTASISSPSGGATVSGSTTVTASATDNVGVAGVQFKLDGNNLGSEDTTSPYSVSWDTTTAAGGSHSLTAVARDTSNNLTPSAGVTVTVNNAPPAGCTVSSSSWQNSGFTSQNGTFTVQFDIKPNAQGIDAVTGLSSGNATGFTSLATIIIFNTSNTIQVRNGGSYASVTSVPYTSGNTYHFRMVVDIAAHTYSVYVTPPSSAEITLATNYAFRTEQAAVGSLNNLAFQSTTGTHNVCAFSLMATGNPVLGDINLDHIVNSLDYSILNGQWFTTNTQSDLNRDGLVNAIDFSMMNANWLRTW